MKNSISIILIILTCQFVFTQKFSIDLPEGEKEIKVNQTNTIFSIYITENKKIFLEDKEIKIHLLESKLKYLSSKLPEILDFGKKLFLYIDKSTDYRFVDAVKTQLAKAKIKYVYYKTGSTEDKDLLKGESAFNYNSISNYEEIIEVETETEKAERQKMIDSLKTFLPKDMPMPPPPPSPPTTSLTFYPKFYSGKKDVINEVLLNKSYKCISLSDEMIAIDGLKNIKIDEFDSLKQQLKDLDFLILNFDDNLTFKNYLNVLKFLQREAQSLYKENDKGFYIIEVSKELNEVYELNKIRLCN